MRTTAQLKWLAYCLLFGSGISIGIGGTYVIFAAFFISGTICGCTSDIILAIEARANREDGDV